MPKDAADAPKKGKKTKTPDAPPPEANGESKGGKYVLYPDSLKVAKFNSPEEAALTVKDTNAIVLRKKDVKKLRKRLKKKL